MTSVRLSLHLRTVSRCLLCFCCAALVGKVHAAGPERAPASGIDGERARGLGSDASKKRKKRIEKEPAARPASVVFTYERQQILKCATSPGENGPVCEASEVVDKKGPAEVELFPIDKRGDADASRGVVHLAFEAKEGVQAKRVELGKGRWEMVWKGASTAKDRFFVVPRDRFEVTLEAFVGMCSEEGSACKLRPTLLQQSIELPEGRSAK